MANFVHLHLHSEYSLLDGACRVKDIPAAALAAGHSAVAITDHGAMYGTAEFYRACRASGIKPIIGCEVYVARRSRFTKEGKIDVSGHHLILLVENEEGYRNLSYLVSNAFIDGFYQKPRIDKELLRSHAKGLIALSACLAGEIPQAILVGDMETAERVACEYRDIFGDGNFYLEIQDHGVPDERTVADALARLSRKLAIPLVATNDVHYLKKSDADTQAILMCIQTNNVISDGRPLGFETDEYYYKSTKEMEELFRDYPDAIENTSIIAARCSFDFTFGKTYLPTYRPDGGESPENCLRRLAQEGFAARVERGDVDFSFAPESAYRERMEYELSVIHSMGFDEYYLIVRDFIAHAKSEGIPVGPGRGSGAGSLVAYCVTITDIDPLRFGLLFERFLNPERVSLPDFDTDFCYVRRDEVIRYVREKYGADHVAQIVTFGTMAARAAVRDVGRALGMSYSEVDRVAKLIPRDLGITIRDALKSKELREMYDAEVSVHRLLDTSMALEGMPRHASTHAAGVVITERPTYEYVPLSVSGEAVVTEFDMTTVADVGLVKFDFLGLRYLTIIHDAEEAVRESDPTFDVTKIPLDDAPSYRLIADGQCDGVFQLESNGMKQMLMQLRPENIDDIIAAIALYRPGPMDSIPTYIACRHGEKKVEYLTPELADILGETYGCIVYQEQVMQIFRALAGYSFARADLVRRAMAKKKADVMQAERTDFLAGCVERGISEKIAGQIFDDMASFASYAFNKSHAAAYAILAYRTAYLKRHYPREYMAALMTSVLGQPGKIGEYIEECRKMGVPVLPPSVNESRKNFAVVGDHIRFGLLALKNVGEKFVEQLIDERKTNGAYHNLDDFLTRMAGNELNKRQVEALIKSGSFDGLGIRRSQMLATYEKRLEREAERVRANLGGQMDLFGLVNDLTPSVAGREYPDIPEFAVKELLALEKESSGMYFSGHLLDDYQLHIAEIKHDDISEILASVDREDGKYTDRSPITVVGIIGERVNKTTRAGEAMAFVTLEDRYAEMELVVFPKVLEKCGDVLLADYAICATGTLSVREGEAPKLLLSKAQMLDTDATYRARHSSPSKRLYLRVDAMTDIRASRAREYAARHPGDVPVVFYCADTGKYVIDRALSVDASDEVLIMLGKIIGDENVVCR